MPTELLSADDLLGLYRTMCTMRHFEAALSEQSVAGNLRGSLHLATGQEALPAGACLALRQDDYLTMTYRGHGYALAKGCDLGKVVAEILGRETGLCRGQGGKMHLFDLDNGVLGANGIVAGGIPTAVGAALSSKLQNLGRVAMTVFGDGAVNQGVAHEVFNMAALWKLPIVFLCENNLYAEMTPIERSSGETDLCKRIGSYGMATSKIDGNDVLAVYDAVVKATHRARAGDGPTFIEAATYRTCGHYNLDPGTTYRTKDEVTRWEKLAPVPRFAAHLTKSKLATKAELAQIDKQSKAMVQQAVDAALSSPSPPESALATGVFV